MTRADEEQGDIPLPGFRRPGRAAGGGAGHPVLATVLDELTTREATGEPVCAFYSDGPDDT